MENFTDLKQTRVFFKIYKEMLHYQNNLEL
jgi:hypothetical protein